MSQILDDAGLDLLFREARTYFKWQDEPVPDALLKRLYDLVKMGPTSANCLPARFVFLRTKEGKERLKPALAPTNVDKTMSAPVTVIVAQDMAFYDKLPHTFPHADARSWFVGNEDLIASTAFRNATLQGGYLILAARALGLDAGPMSGFDNGVVDREFFAGTKVTSNFLVNLGHGDKSALFPRSPRLDFEEACQLV
jgi:3-hydroxypropanoate dehydrogenase